MNRALVLAVGLVLGLGSPVAADQSFAGTWETTFGLMTLKQQGAKVTGHYVMAGTRCTLEGKVEKSRLTFRYQEPTVTGEGYFDLAADGNSFRGKWRARGEIQWDAWVGKRAVAPPINFDGLWDSSFGRIRLVQDGNQVQGVYARLGGSSIAGKAAGKRLNFRYKEATEQGEGWFELTADGQSFEGKYLAKGSSAWAAWNGTRVQPKPERVWLVVVEARWEQSLAEREYAFGKMLKAFFARSARVEVRHRFFDGESSFRKWCGEVAFLAEPVVLVIATHGSPKGVEVDGKTIGAEAIAESLRYARNLRLLHFSACMVMKDRLAQGIHRALDRRSQFPISGYTTAVDWAASAIIEFVYFEMVLLRGLDASQAAAQVAKLLPFSGDKDLPGAAFKSAGFRLLMPSNGRLTR